MESEAFRGLARRVPLRLARRLPRSLAVPVLAARSGGRAAATDHRWVALPAPFALEAYWLRSASGATGPAASVHVGIEEVLRIDGLRGHCHVHYDLAESRARGGAGAAARRRVDDDDIAGWAADELRLNLPYALSLRRRSRRGPSLDPVALDEAAGRLRAEFEALLARHGHEPTGP